MKRVLSLILALSMVMSMFTFSFAGSLKDIEGTEYEAAVEALIELGIVTGYPDGTYQPNKTVSRAEMAKLLVIAAGLEPAAEVAVGTTKFSDVSADHWACGFINVASEYGYIAGYPEGTFMPDAEVKYSEAVTMALRVLGYRNVVEAKGTWPTNYIAKAQDLEMLEGITYGKYSDGAIRGNVAVLVWNMLKENMWDVNAESEGDGLNYTTTAESMLNIKFPDYSYSEAYFKLFEITDDAEVMVTLFDGNEKEDLDEIKSSLENTKYEYFDNDFYTFVYGTKVEVLVNEEDETLLTMVPVGNQKLVEGIKVDLDEDYDEISGDDYDYAYARVKGNKIASSTTLDVESEYVYEVDSEASKKYVKINDEKKYYEKEENVIYIVNGERATVSDIKEGDVVSKVIVNDDKDLVFYIVESSEISGKLTFVEEKEFDNYDDVKTYTVATIGGKEYTLTNAAEKDGSVEAGDVISTYKEDIEDEDSSIFDLDAWNKDMKNEKVEGYLDFLGNLVAVIFDGELNGGDESEETSAAFYGLTGAINRDGSTYSIPVVNEDGEDELDFANKTVANEKWKDDEDLSGYFAIVSLDDNGDLEGFVDYSGEEFIICVDDSGDVESLSTKLYYDEDNNYYQVSGESVASYKEGKIVDENENVIVKVDENTILVKLSIDDKGTKKTTDDVYTVEFEEDSEDIEKIKKEPVVTIVDTANSNFAKAKYVVIFDEVTNGEDDLVGIIKTVKTNELDKDEVLVKVVEDADDEEEDAEQYVYANDNTIESEDLKENYQLIVYSMEEKDEDELPEITVKTGIKDEHLKLDGLLPYIAKSGKNEPSNVEGREFIITGVDALNTALKLTGDDVLTATIDLNDDDVEDLFEDFKILLVDVEADEDDETVYLVDSFDEIDYASIELKELDRLFVDGENDFLAIIRGMKEVPAEEEEEDTTVEESGEKFTVIFNDEDGTELASGEYESGETVVVPEDPEKEGYTFAGWDPEVVETVVADATYVATYTENAPVVEKFTVIFNDEDGTEISSGEYESGETVVVPEDPEKEGYTFAGWDPEVVETVVADATYVATYTENQPAETFTVIFYAEDGTTEIASGDYASGDALVAPQAPDVEGKVFTGWNPEVPATVTASATYTAVYGNEEPNA